MRILDYVVRFAAAVAALGTLSSMPAAGQAPKLSAQQLNPPTSIVTKPITAPKAYPPNLNKPISVPKALAVQRPRPDMKPRPSGGSSGSQMDMIRVQDMVNQQGRSANIGSNIAKSTSNCFPACQNIK